MGGEWADEHNLSGRKEGSEKCMYVTIMCKQGI